MTQTAKDHPVALGYPIRLIGWLLLTVLLTLAVGAMAPQQLPVTLYKLNLIALAGVAGYWLDRSLFPYARPDLFLRHAETQDDLESLTSEPVEASTPLVCNDYGLDLLAAAAMLRRALIVAAAMIAVGLGA